VLCKFLSERPVERKLGSDYKAHYISLVAQMLMRLNHPKLKY
jgi:hypothetical protein